MKHRILYSISGFAAAAALSACGGSNSAGNAPPISAEPITTEEQAARIIANDASDTVSKSVNDGATLTARAVTSAGHNLNYQSDTTGPESASFNVRKNASGALSFEVNGKDWDFDPGDQSDPSSYEVEDNVNDVFVSLWTRGSDLADVFDPGNGSQMQIFGYQTNQIVGGADNTRGYAAVGAETDDAVLSGLPTASYDGRLSADAYPNTGFESNSQSRSRIEGDLTMTANFAAETISGTGSNLTIRNADTGNVETALPGQVIFGQTSLGFNGFKGNLSGDATLNTSLQGNLSGSTYSGAFYGAQAEELGGVMTITGTSEGETFGGVGFIEADKQ